MDNTDSFDRKKHEQMIREFIKEKREECPEEVERVFEKYPVFSPHRIEKIRKREVTVGDFTSPVPYITSYDSFLCGIDPYIDEGGE